MKLVSYEITGNETRHWRPGLIAGGRVVDLSDLLAQSASPQPDAEPPRSVKEVLGLSVEQHRTLALAASALDSGSGLSLADVCLGPPIPDPQKILCLGVNYHEHASEVEMEVPPAPTLFTKFSNALVGSGAAIVLPAVAPNAVDYEGELAVVVGRRCKKVSAADALSIVGGYMPLNDISARDLQLQTSQWTAGKAVDGFAPCGPWLTTADEIADPQKLDLVTRVNGRVRQSANTSQMIVGIAASIAYVSSLITLEVGDIVSTGTPAGVGMAAEPPAYLQAGDTVEVEISGLGTLTNSVELET